MLDQAFQFIVPLENFRKEQIGAVKEGKKKFDKLTAKFCASQERHLGLSRKKQGNVLQDVSWLAISCMHCQGMKFVNIARFTLECKLNPT